MTLPSESWSHDATVRELGEDGLVERLTLEAPLGVEVVAGAGDDCAVVRPLPRGRLLLLKTDAIVEGVHFEPSSPARWVGRKALARVLSDLASMGGTPGQALVTVVLPPGTPVRWIEEVYAGLHELARLHQVSVVGGETTRGAQRLLSVTMTGWVPEAAWVPRGGGKAGDLLMVTGRLGGSLQGKHFHFEPRLAEGRWLARRKAVHAMMDLSDGLAKDLPRLAKAAGLGFQVDWEALPATDGCSKEQAWGDGEDYELLMAVHPASAGRLQCAWRAAFPLLPLSVIGRLTQAGASVEAKAGGWDAFRSAAAGELPDNQHSKTDGGLCRQSIAVKGTGIKRP